MGAEIVDLMQDIEAARQREATERKRQRQQDIVTATQLPPRFHGADFEGFKATTPQQKAAVDACKAYTANMAGNMEKGAALVLTGSVGTGKTLLAAAIARKTALEHVITDRVYNLGSWDDQKRLATVRYTTVMGMLRTIRSTYRKDSHLSESQALHLFTGPDLLILDEVGVQRGTEDEKVQMFEVIDARYGSMLPTVIISNLTVGELTGYIGERVLDRLKDNGGSVVVFDWASHRGASNG